MQFSRVWLHFNPTTLCREGEKNIWILQLCFLPTAGIEPGPPGQQERAFHYNIAPPKVFMMSLMIFWSSCFGQIEMIVAQHWAFFEPIKALENWVIFFSNDVEDLTLSSKRENLFFRNRFRILFFSFSVELGSVENFHFLSRGNLSKKITRAWAMVVAQLVESSFPMPENRGSNPNIGKILSTNCIS